MPLWELVRSPVCSIVGCQSFRLKVLPVEHSCFKLQCHQIRSFRHLPTWKVYYSVLVWCYKKKKIMPDRSYWVLLDREWEKIPKLFFLVMVMENNFPNMMIKCWYFCKPPILKHIKRAINNRFYFGPSITKEKVMRFWKIPHTGDTESLDRCG